MLASSTFYRIWFSVVYCGCWLQGVALLCAAAAQPDYYSVPTFHLSELAQGSRDTSLKDILSSTGLFSIRVPIWDNNNNNNNNNNSLKGLCDCREDAHETMDGAERVLLADGRTWRSTIATATHGLDRPLPLPKADIDRVCNREQSTHASMERARDYVARAVTEGFLPALDRILSMSSSNDNNSNSSYLLWNQRRDVGYSSVSSIVKEAVNLEHFHIYSKTDDATRTTTNKDDEAPLHHDTDKILDWHTDAGLFLGFLPAYPCNNNNNSNNSQQDSSFRIQIPQQNDREFIAKFPTEDNNSVIVGIMLGAGAEHWINTPDTVTLKATRHAVKMNAGDTRAWYGMMHLVNNDAIINQKHQLTFAQWKTHYNPHDDSDVHVGCGDANDVYHDHVNNNVPSPLLPTSHARRRLQHVGGPGDCNNADNFYCWLSCLNVPRSTLSVEEHLKKGESLYCLDPSILADTEDVKKAVNACSNSQTGQAGAVMDGACANYWYHTTEGVQTYTIPKEDPHKDENNNQHHDLHTPKYCYGNTAMYMQGFEWEGTTCVVYLLSNLVVTTRTALIAACLGTILFGMLMEFILRQRRTKLQTLKRGRPKMLWSASLYTVQLMSGYLLMLIVMTYSGPLFLSVIVGLVLGHTLCNWNDIVNKNDAVSTMEGSTPCCQNVMVEKKAGFMNVASMDNTTNTPDSSSDTALQMEEEEDCCGGKDHIA